MRRRGTRRWLTVLIALSAVAPLGAKCSQGGGGATPEARLVMLPRSEGPMAGGRYFWLLDLRVETSVPFQSYEVDLAWTPGSPTHVFDIVPAPEFSGLGKLFRYPQVDPATGSAVGAVDLRRGAEAALTGSHPVAIVVMVADLGEELTLQIDGDVARPDGTLFDTQGGSVTLGPP